MLATNRLLNQLDPWKMLDQFRDWDDQVRHLAAGAGASFEGAVNVWATDDQAVVAMELPGRNVEDIDVSAQHDLVQISAKARVDVPPAGAKSIRRELPLGSVSRTVKLPFELDAERVDAVYEKGILTLTLHRHAASLPAKIEVKAG